MMNDEWWMMNDEWWMNYRGVFLFLIFVCKRNVFNKLRDKFSGKPNKGQWIHLVENQANVSEYI